MLHRLQRCRYDHGCSAACQVPTATPGMPCLYRYWLCMVIARVASSLIPFIALADLSGGAASICHGHWVQQGGVLGFWDPEPLHVPRWATPAAHLVPAPHHRPEGLRTSIYTTLGRMPSSCSSWTDLHTRLRVILPEQHLPLHTHAHDLLRVKAPSVHTSCCRASAHGRMASSSSRTMPKLSTSSGRSCASPLRCCALCPDNSCAMEHLHMWLHDVSCRFGKHVLFHQSSVHVIYCSLQLKKIKDVPRLLHRLRTTLGSTNVRDFQQLLDRQVAPHTATSAAVLPASGHAVAQQLKATRKHV